MTRWKLDDQRFFDPDPAVRQIACDLYAGVHDLPIISPHGHVDPQLLAENTPFPDPAELILIPDHYIYRMLYSRGISLESLGIPTRDGTPVERDRRRIWQIFCENLFLFQGTPTSAWLDYEFVEVFGLSRKPTGDNAQALYDELQERLARPEFLPRALYERFRIEVLCTTHGAADSLDAHHRLRQSGWNGRVIPCLRPDAAFQLDSPAWRAEIDALSAAADVDITSYGSLIVALENRRDYFRSFGATSTDQGVVSPHAHRLSPAESETIFRRALKGKADHRDAERFIAHMLMEMARMSIEDGLVMQIHPGSLRNHNRSIFARFGPDKGCDIPIRTEYTRNLRELLNTYGNDPRLTLIVFTLDESAYSRELAPLAGHYPALKLGPPWWFHDSIEGMTRFRQSVCETAGFYNTVGFNDDTRAFPSIPARHDLARRMDADFLAGKVARHIIDLDDARQIIRALTVDLVKTAYKL
ncbi:glucuronate isomerase [candidate division KSB1 bacterium]|nr:glucuronate isomerase [candidate division KSB1 bacterium]